MNSMSALTHLTSAAFIGIAAALVGFEIERQRARHGRRAPTEVRVRLGGAVSSSHVCPII